MKDQKFTIEFTDRLIFLHSQNDLDNVTRCFPKSLKISRNRRNRENQMIKRLCKAFI